MVHEQHVDGRRFTINWIGAGWYGAQQTADGEHWVCAVADSENLPEWKIQQHGRHLGTLRHFNDVRNWYNL